MSFVIDRQRLAAALKSEEQLFRDIHLKLLFKC